MTRLNNTRKFEDFKNTIKDSPDDHKNLAEMDRKANEDTFLTMTA